MTSSSVASSSNPPKSPPPKEFDVFLSFRGEIRNTFLSHLIKILEDKHVIKFYDEDNIKYGNSINNVLLKAIERSHIAIIFISKGYATSSWCLEEMVKIMECREDYHGLTVIPVFFDVKPTDVRKCEPKSCFGVALAEHELDEEKKRRVPIWKKYLMKVLAICGEDVEPVRGRNEASIVKDIVDDVFRKLEMKNTTFVEELEGMESRVEEIESLLCKEQNGALFIGIHGIGGLGKTTLARYVFDKFRYSRGYDGSCFLEDVRLRKMLKLQRTLLSELQQVKKQDVRDEKDGTNLISYMLRGKKVFLVLDNVDDVKQLESLAREEEWFGGGSVIIVTTIDVNLLIGTYHLLTVPILSHAESMELFRRRAFKKAQPVEGFEQLSIGFVRYASGLPLALRVIGSYLKPLGKDEWESLLASLDKEEMPNDFEAKITSVLRISYDGLTPEQQMMFLDIACFFRGRAEKEVIEKMHSLGLYSRFFKALIAKSLIHIVYVDDRYYFGVKRVKKLVDMHDLVQEMGWRIVHQDANGKLERYSRLWRKKDLHDMLSTNNTVEIEAEVMIVKEYMSGIKLANALKKMNRLRFLEVYPPYIGEDVPCYLPAESLQWLRFPNYPSKAFPEYSNLSKLVCLYMPGSKFERTPDFSDMPMLEILDLSCSNLLEVHESIGSHMKLKNIDLSVCMDLKEFPRIIVMESLETLNLSKTQLRSGPEIQEAQRLRKLDLSNVWGLSCLPWYIGFATGLQELNLSNNLHLETLPANMFLLGRLEILNITNWRFMSFGVGSHDATNRNKAMSNFLRLPLLKTLYMSLCGISELIITERTGWLPLLQFLDLSWNNELISLPESIRQFSCLRTLCLSHCTNLKTVSKLPLSVTSLEMIECISLTRMPDLLHLLNQNEHWSLLDLEGCHQFAQTPQCLSAFRDTKSVYNMLQKRKSLLQIVLPGIMPKWFRNEKTGHRVNVTLDSFSPSSIRGFAVIAISSSRNDEYFKVRTPKNKVMKVQPRYQIREIEDEEHVDTDMEHTGFLYIPIDDVVDGRNWKQGPFLFKVLSSASEVQRWGFHVVYEIGVGEAESGLAVKLAVQLPEETIRTYTNIEDFTDPKDGIMSVKIDNRNYK